jgi:N-acetyl sugar amidotransferase
MKFCKNCILPNTRPGLVIDDSGICNACKNSVKKDDDIDWLLREESFQKVVENAKRKGSGYDCLIPVSGGKDSTWQVIKCLGYGLNPLCFTWRPPGRTVLGQENLDNLIELGVDHIDYSINPEVERKFSLRTLKERGSVAIPMHMAIFNIAPNLALKFNIPLIIWGENSAFEYGSEEESHQGIVLNEAWYKKFGVTHGTTSKDWENQELTEIKLTPYKSPDYVEIEARDIRAVFLGYYFKWDPEMTAKVARENGFKYANSAKVGLYEYADLDDDFISVHHFAKWHKFGFSRIFDNLSLEIRNGRLTREQAIAVLKKNGPEIPSEDIKTYCKFAKIEEKAFFQMLDKFRDKNIWTLDSGVWKIENFLIEDWDWKKLMYESEN